MTKVANPYANLPLRIPMTDWDGVRKFTTTFRAEDRSKPDVDRSPFDRYVDLWWAAFCIGVREGRGTIPSEWHDFVTGVVLNQDPWRIREIELIALATTGAADILDDPGRIISIANEYAATGVPILLDAMTGEIEPVWAVTSAFRVSAEAASRSEQNE